MLVQQQGRTKGWSAGKNAGKNDDETTTTRRRNKGSNPAFAAVYYAAEVVLNVVVATRSSMNDEDGLFAEDEDGHFVEAIDFFSAVSDDMFLFFKCSHVAHTPALYCVVPVLRMNLVRARNMWGPAEPRPQNRRCVRYQPNAAYGRGLEGSQQ